MYLSIYIFSFGNIHFGVIMIRKNLLLLIQIIFLQQ